MTEWGPIRALVAMEIAAGVAVLVAGSVGIGAVLAGFATTKSTPGPCTTSPSGGTTCTFQVTVTSDVPLLACVLIFDVLVIVSAWLLARRGSMRPADVLALRAPLGGTRAALAIACVVAAFLSAEIAAMSYFPSAGAQASQLMAELAAQGGWALAILTIGIVGPLAEEIWLRGFLLSALAKSRLGFWAAGVLIAVLFAVLHAAQYALILLVPIFMLGLVLTWALGITGSLWVPIMVHVGNNLLALFALWMRPPV
jgi:membrane protease YdiL (CAAX protease family)